MAQVPQPLVIVNEPSLIHGAHDGFLYALIILFLHTKAI